MPVVIQLKKAQRTAEDMFRRKIWGGKFYISKYSFMNFFKLFASNIWPLIQYLHEMPPHSVVLDYGCGIGNNSLWLIYGLDYTVVGIDLSEYAVRTARQNISKNKYLAGSKFLINFALADGLSLPFRDNSFDGVFSMDVFGHLPSLNKAFSETSKVLRTGGIGSFCTESAGTTKFRRRVTELLGYNPWDTLDGHISLHTFEELKGMMERENLLVEDRKYEPRFLDLLISTTWSGGGGDGWLEDFIPQLRSHFKLRRFMGKSLESLYSIPILNVLAHSIRLVLYRTFLKISDLDTGEIYVKVKKGEQMEK